MSFIIIAVLGLSPINFFIASDVFPFATDSKNLPNNTNVIITPALSKYILWIAIISPLNVRYKEYKLYDSAAPVPMAIKESILGDFDNIAFVPIV